MEKGLARREASGGTLNQKFEMKRFSIHPILCISAAWILAGSISTALSETSQRLSDGWEYYQGSLGSIWEIWRGDAATDNVSWNAVSLPHCFNARDAVDPEVRYYQGPGWYRKQLQTKNPFTNGRTLIHFNGAGQKSQVFVGMDSVGEHLGGYDEWTVDITDAVAKTAKNGIVPLAVRCDNSRDAEAIPSDLSDFNRYGGLYRHVTLNYVPAISLERIHLEPTLASDGKATVKLRAQLYNPEKQSDELELKVEFSDPSGKVIDTQVKKVAPWSGENELGAITIPKPELWSPKAPALYHCSVTLVSKHGEQKLSDRFGIRSVEWVEHGPFKLNGERLLLRGTHYHEDHAGVAAAVPDEVVRHTLRSMKEMGANFVRLSHYQQAPLVLELCDELGLLVWEEIPWCRGGLGGVRYKQQCRDMLTNLIGQHYNHPSVILWGLGNENDWPGDFEEFDKKAIHDFMAELNSQAHQLDPSRKTCIRRCDFCKDVVDVYSPSIWAGWYGGRYTEYRKSTDKAIKDTPHFFHAEYGGDSHAGRHAEEPETFLAAVAIGKGTAEVGKAYKGSGGEARASKDGDWSESYIVNLFDWHLKEQESMPNLTGAAQWIFKDFSTPLRPENPVPRVNQKGVVERDGTPKESYYVFQSYWADKPMIHIYGHSWQTRWGKLDEKKIVKVFSNCEAVELFVNGVSAGVKRRDVSQYPAAGLNWAVSFKEGVNELRAVGRHDEKSLTDQISLSYQTAVWSKPAKVLFKEISQSEGVATVEARVVDAAGVPCLDAANLVRFGLTGDGRLLDNLGTASGSRNVQMTNGHAKIGVNLTGNSAVASVSIDGLETEFLNLKKLK